MLSDLAVVIIIWKSRRISVTDEGGRPMLSELSIKLNSYGTLTGYFKCVGRKQNFSTLSVFVHIFMW